MSMSPIQPQRLTPPPPPERGWWSVPEAAKIIGIHPVTIYQWVNEGRLTCHRAGRGLRFFPADIEKFWRSSERRGR